MSHVHDCGTFGCDGHFICDGFDEDCDDEWLDDEATEGSTRLCPDCRAGKGPVVNDGADEYDDETKKLVRDSVEFAVKVLSQRKQACQMLERLHERFACAACRTETPPADCPCGFSDVSEFLRGPDIIKVCRNEDDGA